MFYLVNASGIHKINRIYVELCTEKILFKLQNVWVSIGIFYDTFTL